MNWRERIEKLGIEIPTPAEPVGSYMPARRAGGLVFTSGQLPMKDGRLLAIGKVPVDVSLQLAQRAARQALLNALAAVRDAIGSLDAVASIVRLNVFVNSSPGFTDQAKVADGASDLLTDIFGRAGKHTRCAIGVAELPLGSPVELDIIVEAIDIRS